MSRPLVDGPKYINFQFESRRSCMEYMETITFHDVDRDSRESLVVVVCGGNSNSSNLKIARRGVRVEGNKQQALEKTCLSICAKFKLAANTIQ